MKRIYSTPRAEKLDFDYTKAVIASGTGKHGDNGHQWGCERTHGWGSCGEVKPENGRHCW